MADSKKQGALAKLRQYNPSWQAASPLFSGHSFDFLNGFRATA
jgi:hypothetical protein